MESLALASLEYLLKQPINSKITLLVVDILRTAIRCTSNNIDNSLSRRKTSPLSEVLKQLDAPYVPPLNIYVKDLIRRSNVSTGTVIVSLVYIARLQKKLPEATQAKTLNDSSPKNRHWARYASCFPLAEDYDLSVTEDDLFQVCSPLIDAHISLSMPLTPPLMPSVKSVDEEHIIEGYIRDNMEISDDSAYSSDSELTPRSIITLNSISPTSDKPLGCPAFDSSLPERWETIW
ncbi:hypothetical protein NQZ79_g720 [Umbelopsis isabellina]|nr:hypothetical protein NQZ79_g720 [Umbelopsis isabellina]